MKEANQSSGKSVLSGLSWKLAERMGVQISLFVLQVVLARILDPEHYGVLSMMLIFTTLANVFIQRGFSTSLVQNKDVTEEDYSSVFWITMTVALALYVILFLSAPLIAAFYDMPTLVDPFRVLCLVLFPGALNSVQIAKISRGMDFKKVFRSNIAAILISGALGIAAALMGAGLWALVIQKLVNVTVACIVMWFSVKWRPRKVFNIQRIKVLFGYGWKLLVSGLLDTLYQDLRSLVVGKKYDSGTLGYYNRGKQFPQLIINAVNTTVQSVMLPSFSKKQDRADELKDMMRKSIVLSSYILFPMMAGLAGVAEPLVRIVLTEKWLPCVPYMQIYCFTMAFRPVHSCNLQAINAVGRSDVFLKLEAIKKTIGVAALVIAVLCFDSPVAIAATGAITAVLNCFINSYPNRRLVNYSYAEQMKDIIPSLLAAAFMFLCVSALGLLRLNVYLLLGLQIITGVALYVGISVVFKLKPYQLLLKMLRKKVFKKKQKEEQ